MASVELGPSVLAGVITPQLTKAGAGFSPSSAAPYSESSPPTSILTAADGSSSIRTVLAPAPSAFSHPLRPQDGTNLGMTQLPATNSAALSGASGSVLYYKMRGMDHNVFGLYDTWLVLGAPDYAQANYNGSLATPLRDVVISAAWGLG